MDHAYILWVSTLVYAIHVFEEYFFDWKKWATTTFKFQGLEWATFYLANAVVVVVAISAAMIGWRLPAVALIIPALQLINGLFFHILPTIIQRRFSPGVITSVILFLPVAIWAYLGAYWDGVLTIWVLILSLIFGWLLMATPFIFFKLRDKFFK